ncbi:centrosome-associated protein CEP250-like [Cocos nucifera]|uniref:Centrosome-associated protein CEP250-like n=1 Tax=Cocos nucifera TaxID=13894 RepID=A0A8K0HUC4_COCNU|nr:centrosome-associated protein CEP250-like [Cocos nucifera]
MARKKASPAAAEKEESHSLPPSGRDASPDKMECLKTLNHLLVKETVELRQQVDHLRSRLDGLSDDGAFLAGVERDVNRLFLSSGLAEREIAVRRVEADLRSLAGAEERVRSLQAMVNSMAEELRSSGERLEMVVGERDEMKKALDLALSEKDSNLTDLDRKEKELRVLEATVRELETGIAEAGANLGKLEIERYDLVEQGKKREETIHSLLQDNASMETSLDEYRQLVECLERKMEEVIKIKQEAVETVKAKEEAIAAKVSALEAERQSLVENNQIFAAEAGGLKAAIYSMKIEEEGLRNEIAEMEKKNVEVTEELLSEVAKKEAVVAKVSTLESELRSLLDDNHRLGAELNNSKSAVELLKEEEEGLRSQVVEMEKRNEKVTEELERLQAELGALEKEKEGTLLGYEEQMMAYVKELDGLKTRMGEIEREKDAIEGLRAVQQSEIDTLQKELQRFRSTVHELQDLCNDYTNTNTQLQAERDSVRRDLDLQKVEEGCWRGQIEELQKRNNVVEEEMQQLRGALGDFAHKEEWKVQSDVLKSEKASIEKKLMTAQQRLEDTDTKFRASDMNSQRALSLLKDTTTEMMHGLSGGYGHKVPSFRYELSESSFPSKGHHRNDAWIG